MTIMVIFLYNLYILGSSFKLFYIQYHVIMNSVIKRFVCMYINKVTSDLAVILTPKGRPIIYPAYVLNRRPDSLKGMLVDVCLSVIN